MRLYFVLWLCVVQHVLANQRFYQAVGSDLSDYLYNTKKYPNKIISKYLVKTPIGLDEARQAEFLDGFYNRENEKGVLKVVLSKEQPYLIRWVNGCLANPWLNRGCTLKKFYKQLEFLCLSTSLNKNSYKLFYTSKSTRNLNYESFCWIVNSINLIEYCETELLFDKNCLLIHLKTLIESCYHKCKYEISFKYSLFAYYCDLFIEKSLELLIEILTIWSNNDILKQNNLYDLVVKLLEANIGSHVKHDPKYNLFKYKHNKKEYLILRFMAKLNEINLNMRNKLLKQVAYLLSSNKD